MDRKQKRPGKGTLPAPAKDFELRAVGLSIRVTLLKPDWIARSAARRLLVNLEKFREIVLDFRDVRSVGQGFADEVFRVFAQRHPGIVLQPENANSAVMAMIRHVSREAPVGSQPK